MSEIDSSLLLMSEDKANEFSIVADGCHNTTLLKQDKRVAWFSAAVTREVMKDCERSVKRGCIAQRRS